MKDICIRVNGVCKSYNKYAKNWHRYANWLGLAIAPEEKITVLNQISFDVQRGETIALVGENGAGKSTLLKAITGTIIIDNGHIELQGRVSSILELGLGFNPDMTGRENVYLAGSVMGYTDHELSQLEEPIKAFSELTDYFDKPVRTYSSGMQMRLAFSVATATRPDILIVDEALSVGDSYFQHKSFNRIKEFRSKGTSLLFVSHDKSSIQTLCDRAILLEKGIILKDGQPEAVMDFYNALIAEKENKNQISQSIANSGRIKTISGTREAIITEVWLLNEQSESIEYVEVGQPVTLRICATTQKFIPKLVMGYGIRDRLGQVIFGTNTDLTQQVLLDLKIGTEIEFNVQFPANLGQGSYSIQVALTSSDTHLENNYEWQDNALIFQVVNTKHYIFEGCNWIKPDIRVTI